MSTVLIYSGGMDSTTLLYDLLAQGELIRALSVNYGQRHARELVAAQAITAACGVMHEVVDLRSLRPLLQGSSQTSDELPVPFGHYEEASMRITVVPNRNMVLLAAAIAWAISTQSDSVAYAAHAGDHAIYPDCRDEFAEALERAAALADWHPVRLQRPYIGLDKAAIVARGAALGVPYVLTYSCYCGRAQHCGRCGTCVERREAFQRAGVADPTEYEELA